MKREVAKKAARWWADQLRGRAILDNGDYSTQGVMTTFLANMCQEEEKKHQTPEQIDAFERELEQAILGYNDEYFTLSVDYHPDHILILAAERAGITLGMTTLPWKTHMTFDEGNIQVACGYGASFVQL